MLRKMILALAASATLGAAALSPTTASAWGGHPGWRGGWHGGWGHPFVRGLHGAALGLHALRTGAALGQSLLLIESQIPLRQTTAPASPEAGADCIR